MARLIGLLAGACIGVVSVDSVHAHHSFSMFDAEVQITLEGTVVEYRWKNPHTHIIVSISDESGDSALAGTWEIEGASISIMRRQGWNKGSFKPGEKIVVVVNPLRNGEKGGALVYAIDKNGERLYPDTERY